jgi:hypothetical protein
VGGHAVEDDAGVEGGAFDGGEEFILAVVWRSRGGAGEFGIGDGAVAIVPSEAEDRSGGPV